MVRHSEARTGRPSLEHGPTSHGGARGRVFALASVYVYVWRACDREGEVGGGLGGGGGIRVKGLGFGV
jgi:hypothetical protein